MKHSKNKPIFETFFSQFHTTSKHFTFANIFPPEHFLRFISTAHTIQPCNTIMLFRPDVFVFCQVKANKQTAEKSAEEHRKKASTPGGKHRVNADFHVETEANR